MPLRVKARLLLEDTHPSALARVALSPLTGLGKVYGKALAARRGLYRSGVLCSKAVPLPVISVGNITMGGTGKTPMVELLCGLLSSGGMSPVVISRGYGGSMEGKTGVVSDGKKIFLTADEAGDEPLALARRLAGTPVVIGADRVEAARLVAREKLGDVAVLDDGFQHLRIARDLDIVLLDGTKPFGSGHCLPRGTLRENCRALADADVVVITRAGRVEEARLNQLKAKIASINPDAVVFTGDHLVENVLEWPGGERRPPEFLNQRKVLAFAGIARPEGFFAALEELGAVVTHRVEYADHRHYSRGDVEKIVNWARLTNAEALVTTEKDAVRLEKYLPLGIPLWVLTVRMALDAGSDAFGKIALDAARAGGRGKA